MAMSLDSRPAMCSRSRPREHRLKHHRRPRRSRPLPSRRRSPSNHLHAHESSPDCRQFHPLLCERRRLAFRSTTTINLDDFSSFAPSTNLNKPLPPPPMSGLSASLNLASLNLAATDRRLWHHAILSVCRHFNTITSSFIFFLIIASLHRCSSSTRATASRISLRRGARR